VQPLFEHRLTLAGFDTRALELEGEGPPLLLLHGWADSADTWRLLLDNFGRGDRRAVALDMPRFGTASAPSHDRPLVEQLDEFCDAAVEYVAPGGGAVVAGNSLGGCVALRAAEREELGLGGVVPVAPAGLDMARWFVLVERDRVVRWLLGSPVPLPGPLVRAAVGEAYRRLAFLRPGTSIRGSCPTSAPTCRARRLLRGRWPLAGGCCPSCATRSGSTGCPVPCCSWGRHDLRRAPHPGARGAAGDRARRPPRRADRPLRTWHHLEVPG
jgi:pimeloyl-ACP methyl ester carboxylesterase